MQRSKTPAPVLAVALTTISLLAGCQAFIDSEARPRSNTLVVISEPTAQFVAPAIERVLTLPKVVTQPPAVPAVDLSLLFSTQALDAQVVLNRWYSARLQMDEAIAQYDFLNEVVAKQSTFAAHFGSSTKGDASALASLNSTRLALFDVMRGLNTRMSRLRQHSARVNELGWEFSQVADLSPEVYDAAGGPDNANDDKIDLGTFIDWLNTLNANIDTHAAVIAEVEKELLALRAAHPEGQPIPGGSITSMFGPRKDPIHHKRRMHAGIDFGARRGTPIHAVAAGKVIYSGWRSGYGRVVEIDHGNGYTTRYAHNSKNRVKKGSFVKRGDVIANVGASGRATGAHLHFEIRKAGKPVNPSRFIKPTSAL